MKKNCLLKSAAGALLLGVFALSSCVQDDMYELYDDPFEIIGPRKKRAKDNYGQYNGVNQNPNAYSDYPTMKQIRDAIETHMHEVWSQTRDYCTDGWGELGFLIFYEPLTHEITFGETIEGTKKSWWNNDISINLGVEDLDWYDRMRLCGTFHTHPRIENCPYYQICRLQPGPSSGDKNNAEKRGIPGFVYDYSYDVRCCNMSDNEQGKIYEYGPNKRNK